MIKQRKGIVLAGGSGTRLYPLTLAVSKQLMPVYDKPMIYYPISMLMLASIREILIISTPQDLPNFKKLLGDGSAFGVQFSYAEQPRPEGLAQAFIIAEDFLKNTPSALVLGDNLFYGSHLSQDIQKVTNDTISTIFAYPVSNPHDYGVVEFDTQGNALSIEEKPKNPKSHYAVPGLYFYDEQASAFAKTLKPSARGELEITDLNLLYLHKNQLKVQILSRGTAWLDTGNPSALIQAAQFVEVVEKRQGLKIACLEEIAFYQQWITRNTLQQRANELSKCEYGQYLHKIAQDTQNIHSHKE